MKYTIFSCLLAALCSGTTALSQALQPIPLTVEKTLTYTAPKQTQVLEAEEPHPHLDIRQGGPGVVGPGVAASVVNPEQVPAVTTIQGSIIYTQTFPPTPGLLPPPGSGQIGYGTLQQKRKREVQTIRSASVETLVMAMRTAVVTVPVQRFTGIFVTETVVVTADNQTLANMTGSASNGTAVSAGFATGLLSLTAISRPT